MTQVSLSTSTNFDGDANALIEDQGTELTFRIDLDEAAPAEGLRIFIDSDTEQILNRLDLPAVAANPVAENIDLLSVRTNLDNSGLAFIIQPGTTFATVTIPIFDNPEPDTFLPETFDGLVEATFSIVTASEVSADDTEAITGLSDITIDPDGESSVVIFADDESQLAGDIPTPEPPEEPEAETPEVPVSSGYDEAVDGDISNDPANPLQLELSEGTTTLSASTGDGDQEYVTVTVPEGFQLDSLVLEDYTPNDVGFIGVQEGDTFTEPLDDSAVRENILGYTLFGNPRQVGTDILDEIGNGLNAQGFEGALPSGTYTFALQQLSPNSDYTLAFNVTEEVSTTPETPETSEEQETPETPETPESPMSELPVVSFEVVPDTFSEESADNLVEWVWTVEGDFPEEGITVNLETSGGNPDIPFDFTNQFAAEPESEFVNADIVGFDDATGDLNILLTEPEASFQLFFANDIIEEGAQPFEFQLVEGDGYTVDPETNGTIFTITDDNGGPGVGPSVGISASATELVEGDAITISFTVDGEIPEGGVQILVQSPVAGALGQFDISDLSTLELTGIEGVPEVGDAAGGSFLLTITEPTATITTSVFNDIVAEEPLELPFEIVNGEEYEVNPNASSVTLNIVDEPQPEGPTIGISVDETDVFEGDTITLTFDVEGEIPEGGVRVLVNDVESAGSQLRSLTEFDVANIETTGIEGFPEPADGDSGFFVNITEPGATITLPIFDEGADEDEALESFTFEVIDGEAYNINPDAGSITLNIADVGDTQGESDPIEEPTDPPAGDLPVLSFTASTDSLNEAEGTPLVLNFSVEGEFPEEGVVVRFNEDFFDTEQIDFNIFELENLEFFDFEETSPGRFTIDYLLSAPEGSLTTAVFDDNIAEPEGSYSPGILPVPDANYTINPDAASVDISVIDGVEGTGGPAVSITAEPTELNEGDQLTLTLTAEGEIPEGGIEVNIDSETEAAVGDFITTSEEGIPLAEITGFEGALEPNGDASGFIGTMVENTATITFDVFDDGPTEGTEVFDFSVLDGENYDLGDNDLVSLTISDDGENTAFEVESGVTSVFLDLPLLEEAAGLTLVGTDSDAEPFSEDFQVGFTITEETDFIFSPVTAGETSGAIAHSGTITLGLGDAEATVGEFSIGFDESRVSDTASGFFVADTLEDPLGLEVLFDLSAPEVVSALEGNLELAGTDLLLAPEVATALGMPDLAGADVGDARIDAEVSAIAIDPGESPVEDEPVVSFSIEPDVVIEEDEGASFTGVFTVDGEIPPVELDAEGNPVSGGLSVILDVKEVAELGPQFDTFDVDGLAFGPFSDPEQPNLFEFILFEETSTVTINIFNDIIEEEPFEFNFELIDGEGIIESDYIVDSEVNSDSFILEDGNGGPGVGPTVGLAVSETELAEGDEFTVDFSVEGEIPESGVTVLVSGDAPGVLGEFALFDSEGTPLFETSGIEGVPEAGDGVGSSFFVTLTEADASITLTTFTEDEAEGLEEFSFSLVDGEIYEVDAAASEIAFSIDDGDTPPEETEEPAVEVDFEPVFGSIGADIIEVEGSGQLIFAGDLNDLVDASTGDGENRILAGSGDDTVILGASDRILAGDGDDTIFTAFGGDNTITGGAGADQFWIATAELPESTNIINDFTSGEDVIGIAGLGIGFSDLDISDFEGGTLISANGNDLAVISNAPASFIANEDHFAFA